MNYLKVTIALSFVITFITTCVAFGSVEKHVYIKNDIPGKKLTVHCKSADDDLGSNVLPPGGQWGFGFHTMFLFGTTLFYCGFEWDGESHSFTVYDDNRDRYTCDNCMWSIRTNGTCLSSSSINHPSCYDWQ